MSSKHRFTTFASVLSKNIIRRTAIVFITVLAIVMAVSMVTVYEQSSVNASNILEISRLEVEEVLSNVESIAHTYEFALPDMMGNDDFIQKTTKEAVKYDDKIIACGIAYEPFLHNPEDEFYMILSTRNDDKSVSTELMGSLDFDYFYQDWYQIPKSTGEPMWNEPSKSLNGSVEQTVSYSMPLYDLDGIFIGILRLDLDLNWLASVVEKSNAFEKGEISIVSNSGSYIVSKNMDDSLQKKLFSKDGDKKFLEMGSTILSTENGFMSYNENARQKYLGYSTFDNDWVIIGTCAYRDFFKSVHHITFIILLIAFIGLVILYFYTKKTINRLSKSITEITYSAMNMSRGNFKATIPDSDSQGEIKRLETSMHYLQNTVNDYFSLLKNATAKQERIESELAIANKIQQSFLPHTFERSDSYECYGSIIPAKEVGGDLFDVRREGDWLYFSVGDVSGKGVPAAMFMAITQSAFNFFRGQCSSTLEIVSSVNNVFSEGNKDGMFVTLFVARVNLKSLEMEYCNGGHNPVIIVNDDNEAHFIKAESNLAVGLFPNFPYVSEKIQLRKGCRLLLYTDGVSEAENRNQELFGDDRLLKYASSIAKSDSSKTVVENLFTKIRQFADGNEQNDDITIFSIKFE